MTCEDVHIQFPFAGIWEQTSTTSPRSMVSIGHIAELGTCWIPDHGKLFLLCPSAINILVWGGLSDVPCQGSSWGLPMALVFLTPFEDFQHGNDSSELFKHRDHLPFISCSSCGINTKITHFWVQPRDFWFVSLSGTPKSQLSYSPGELVPWGGTGGWELCTHCSCCQWGAGETSLRTFGPQPQAEVGKWGFLLSHNLYARRRRAAQGAAAALGLQCPIHDCKKQFWWAQAPPELPLRAKPCEKVSQSSVEPWLCVPGAGKGLCDNGSRGAHLAGDQAGTCLIAMRPASPTN